MKKMLLSAAALLCTFAALAQAPTTGQGAATAAAVKSKNDGKPEVTKLKHDEKVKKAKTDKVVKIKKAELDDLDKNGKADTHGQQVQAVAHTTPLTGSAKGNAVSTVASAGRSNDHGQHAEHAEHAHRSARAGGEHAHDGIRATGHQGGAGHSTDHHGKR